MSVDTKGVPDVPSQYKPVIDQCTIALVDAAKRIWPIVRELGETFECEGERFIVTVKPKSGVR